MPTTKLRTNSKKTLEDKVQEVALANPGAEVRAWAEDEARYGLIPTTRRVWATVRRRPLAMGRRKYKWGYLYGFVEPETGRLFNLFADCVNTEMMNEALRQFAAFVGVGAQNQVVLVLDNAGWHASKELNVPAGIHLCFLPPYSPELQPAERLWPLVNEAVANRAFASMDELDKVVGTRVAQLEQQPDVVRAHTHWHWWPGARCGLRVGLGSN